MSKLQTPKPFRLINFRGLKGLGIPFQVYMSEQILQNSEVCIRSLAFIRRLRVHGILRANIKCKIIEFSFECLKIAEEPKVELRLIK